MTNAVQVAIAILIQIESHGNPLAIGRAGEVGILQIRPCIIADVNQAHGTHYTNYDRFDPFVSIAIAQLWLTDVAKRRGITDPRKLCYRWNAPRTGRPAPGYVQKVQREYAKQSIGKNQ